MSDANPRPGGTALRVVGIILMIIGFLLLSAAGLCTLIFGGAILSDGPYGADIGLVLVYGGIPMILGMIMAYAGYNMWKGKGPQ